MRVCRGSVGAWAGCVAITSPNTWSWTTMLARPRCDLVGELGPKLFLIRAMGALTQPAYPHLPFSCWPWPLPNPNTL